METHTVRAEEQNYTHESFGQIRFSRVNGDANFYGSELKQDHYISMEVHGSEMNRTDSKDWYFPRSLKLRLRMSSGQFSELITSLNNGSGVPCTLEYFNGVKVEKLPSVESRKEYVHKEFQNRMESFAKEIKESDIKDG